MEVFRSGVGDDLVGMMIWSALVVVWSVIGWLFLLRLGAADRGDEAPLEKGGEKKTRRCSCYLSSTNVLSGFI